MNPDEPFMLHLMLQYIFLHLLWLVRNWKNFFSTSTGSSHLVISATESKNVTHSHKTQNMSGMWLFEICTLLEKADFQL